jgi:hypothetical protein
MQQTFGARLRSQRERQEISLSVIAEQTKIRASLLDSLERDDISQWPGGIFRRAYVRTYAQAIGLDPDAVVREFLELYPDPMEEDVTAALAAARESSRPRTRLGLLLGSALEALPVRRQPPAPATIFSTPPPIKADARRASPDSELSLKERPAAPAEPEAPLFELTPGGDQEADEAHADVEEPAPADVAHLFLEPTLECLAEVCTRIASAANGCDVADAVADAAGCLDASGLILWAWDADDDSLSPCLAHGYSQRLLNDLPRVYRGDDNPVADTFRTTQTHVVDSEGGGTGALVVPLINAYGCVGVLALELRAGTERRALVRIMATLLAAQLATLVTPVSSLAAKTA